MVRGTLIMTPAGERSVESFQAGDVVVTKSGAARPIKWVGVRTLQKEAGTSWQAQELPVKVHASAIADNVPSRDVFLSQEHAIDIDGALVGDPSLRLGAGAYRIKVGKRRFAHVRLR